MLPLGGITMGRLKTKLFQLLDFDDEARTEPTPEIFSTLPAEVEAEVEKDSPLVVVDYNGVEIFTATPDDFYRWRVFGYWGALWDYLYWHGKNFRFRLSDYRDFNVGYDREKHCAIFQLDDAGHYCRIQFDDTDTAPINPPQALSVLALLADLENEFAKLTRKPPLVEVVRYTPPNYDEVDKT